MGVNESGWEVWSNAWREPSVGLVLMCCGCWAAWDPHWRGDLVPEGMGQSLCQHQAELLLGVKAEEQLDVFRFR